MQESQPLSSIDSERRAGRRGSALEISQSKLHKLDRLPKVCGNGKLYYQLLRKASEVSRVSLWAFYMISFFVQRERDRRENGRPMEHVELHLKTAHMSGGRGCNRLGGQKGCL